MCVSANGIDLFSLGCEELPIQQRPRSACGLKESEGDESPVVHARVRLHFCPPSLLLIVVSGRNEIDSICAYTPRLLHTAVTSNSIRPNDTIMCSGDHCSVSRSPPLRASIAASRPCA